MRSRKLKKGFFLLSWNVIINLIGHQFIFAFKAVKKAKGAVIPGFP